MNSIRFDTKFICQVNTEICFRFVKLIRYFVQFGTLVEFAGNNNIIEWNGGKKCFLLPIRQSFSFWIDQRIEQSFNVLNLHWNGAFINSLNSRSVNKHFLIAAYGRKCIKYPKLLRLWSSLFIETTTTVAEANAGALNI